MKPILFFALLISFSAQAQHSIKGNLFDSLANKPVVGATITLLKQKDSALVSFSMTDSKGGLLKILFQNRDKIVDRKDILNLLWGNDSFFNSRNLDVYITKLRGYLKQDESVEILTIKGVGYRFVTS